MSNLPVDIPSISNQSPAIISSCTGINPVGGSAEKYRLLLNDMLGSIATKARSHVGHLLTISPIRQSPDGLRWKTSWDAFSNSWLAAVRRLSEPRCSITPAMFDCQVD